MKYFIAFIIAVICIIGVNFFLPSSEIDNIPELVIQAYMFGNEVDDPNKCDNFGKFNYEPLEIGVARNLAPVIGTKVINLGFFFEFEGGIIEVISEDEDVQLSMTDSASPWGDEDIDHRIFGFKLKVGNKGYISLNPLGSGCGTLVVFDESMRINGEIGKEYRITINAYEFANEKSPVITAKIILTQLNDEMQNTCVSGSSRFFSVELVSYECSETYLVNFQSNRHHDNNN